MSKIQLSGQAWRENGQWRFTLQGPDWVIKELVASELKLSGDPKPEGENDMVATVEAVAVVVVKEPVVLP